MEDQIDNEILISQVKIRPVLWDKSLEIFKDRLTTRTAWREICSKLNEEFEDMADQEKNEFGKSVIKRWTNLRDAYSKSRKKRQECKRSGFGTPTVKKYVYHNQMKFLNKLYDSNVAVDSLDPDNEEDELGDSEQPQTALGIDEGIFDATSQEIHHFGIRKRRKSDEIQVKVLKARVTDKPNSHMAFFESVMPHLTKFDDTEFLEFQMGVLQVIQRINGKKKTIQGPTYNSHQVSSDQLPSSPSSHPSCSN